MLVCRMHTHTHTYTHQCSTQKLKKDALAVLISLVGVEE